MKGSILKNLYVQTFTIPRKLFSKKYFADTSNTFWKSDLSQRAKIYGGPCNFIIGYYKYRPYTFQGLWDRCLQLHINLNGYWRAISEKTVLTLWTNFRISTPCQHRQIYPFTLLYWIVEKHHNFVCFCTESRIYFCT